MEADTLKLDQTPGFGGEADFLHKIGEHVAKGDTLDETLASTIDFAVWLLRCEECSIYIREGAELVPWVWKYSADRALQHSRIAVDRGYAASLAEHRLPIAIFQDASGLSKIRHFDEWSTDPGETFVSIPLVARSKLLGTINLKHRQPYPYSRREFKLLSSVGYLLGADILISQLESENAGLVLDLETRKLVERGKGILQRDLGLSEDEAYLALQRQSREKGRPMKEIAQAIILHDEVRRGSLAN